MLANCQTYYQCLSWLCCLSLSPLTSSLSLLNIECIWLSHSCVVLLSVHNLFRRIWSATRGCLAQVTSSASSGASHCKSVTLCCMPTECALPVTAVCASNACLACFDNCFPLLLSPQSVGCQSKHRNDWVLRFTFLWSTFGNSSDFLTLLHCLCLSAVHSSVQTVVKHWLLFQCLKTCFAFHFRVYLYFNTDLIWIIAKKWKLFMDFISS